MAIPRIIFQSHESQYTFGNTFKKCQAKLRELHPSYDYQFFSASNRREFIRTRRPELLDLYDFYPRNIQRADLFRVIAVHEMGGIYLDLDVFPHQPLDALLAQDLVLTEEWKMSSSEYERRHFTPPQDERDLIQIGNYGFAATPQHWFFAEVIDEMLRRAASAEATGNSPDDVFFTTGPDLLSDVFARHRDELTANAHVLQGSQEERWCQFGPYGAHLMAGSWA